MSIRVQVGNRVVEFPDGTPEAEMRAALDTLPPEPASSHGVDEDTQRAASKATGISSNSGTLVSAGGRGTRLDVRKSDNWLHDNAPAIGATMATLPMGGGGGFLPLVLRAGAAGAGGAAGSGLRGDDLETMAAEGGKQALLQTGGEAAVGVGSRVARGLMRGGIPKGIQADFGGKTVAQEALDTGAIPGVEASAKRISRLSHEANQGLETAAQQVPTLPSRKILDGLKPLHDAAVTAKMPARAKAIAERGGEIRREVGTGLSPAGQLARKGIKTYEGRAALNAPNSKMAGLDSQLADAERDAVMSHLHETPGMKDALSLSQRRMGLDRFMQDSLTSNMVNRMGGGPINMLRSPMGLGIAGHAVNQGSKAFDPQVIRALMALFNQRSEDE